MSLSNASKTWFPILSLPLLSYSDLPTSTSSNEALNNTQKNPCRSWRWGPRWPRGHAICSSITFTTCWVSLAAFFNTCSHLLTWWSTVFPPRLTSPRRIRLWSLSHIWAQVIRQQVHKGGSCSLLLSTKILLLVSSNQARYNYLYCCSTEYLWHQVDVTVTVASQLVFVFVCLWW